ncbi:hypothetical protein [Archangium primigenium]|uniref:hypothetical protein n=1 Tax=[Archangium] primigenium TaxID=2792470 RepID=UPI001957FFF0|nr:hypothetical protein [Archangium primigenium]MBM7112003.1 hypothetical protein [Archangium primigenium]
MNVKDIALASLLALTGCGLFVRQGPPLIPLEDDPSVVFPPFFDRVPTEVGASGGITLVDGEALRALQIAANDFLPPDSADVPCALKKEAQSYRILRQGDVFFISISENPAHCGRESPALDSGARYAIRRDGRILRRRLDGQPEFPREPSTDSDGTWTPAEPGVSAPLEEHPPAPDAG